MDSPETNNDINVSEMFEMKSENEVELFMRRFHAGQGTETIGECISSDAEFIWALLKESNGRIEDEKRKFDREIEHNTIKSTQQLMQRRDSEIVHLAQFESRARTARLRQESAQRQLAKMTSLNKELLASMNVFQKEKNAMLSAIQLKNEREDKVTKEKLKTILRVEYCLTVRKRIAMMKDALRCTKQAMKKVAHTQWEEMAGLVAAQWTRTAVINERAEPITIIEFQRERIDEQPATKLASLTKDTADAATLTVVESPPKTSNGTREAYYKRRSEQLEKKLLAMNLSFDEWRRRYESQLSRLSQGITDLNAACHSKEEVNEALKSLIIGRLESVNEKHSN